QRQHLGGIDALAVGLREVAGAEVADDAVDGAGLIVVSLVPLKLRNVGGDAEKERQVSAGRSAHDADAIRVDVIFRMLAAQPAHGGLAVEDGGGESVLG